MPELSTQSKKLQWKWVGISVLLYAVFYLLPLLILMRMDNPIGAAWLFAGIIVIAAIAGYLSEGVTIVEPAIASAGLILLFFIATMVFIPRQVDMIRAVIPMAFVMAGVFLLSVLGAWLGERAQKLWKTRPSESAQPQ
jgi:Na+/citrate or Na+/malate symporter